MIYSTFAMAILQCLRVAVQLTRATVSNYNDLVFSLKREMRALQLQKIAPAALWRLGLRPRPPKRYLLKNTCTSCIYWEPDPILYLLYNCRKRRCQVRGAEP